MNENVVSIGKAAIVSDRRAAFMEAVAQSFELYVAEYGFEPDSVVYTPCGLKQPSQIAWMIEGESQAGPASILSLAAVHTLAAAGSSQQGIP